MNIEVDKTIDPSSIKKIIKKMESVMGVNKCSVDTESNSINLMGRSMNQIVIMSILKNLGYEEKYKTKR